MGLADCRETARGGARGVNVGNQNRIHGVSGYSGDGLQLQPIETGLEYHMPLSPVTPETTAPIPETTTPMSCKYASPDVPGVIVGVVNGHPGPLIRFTY